MTIWRAGVRSSVGFKIIIILHRAIPAISVVGYPHKSRERDLTFRKQNGIPLSNDIFPGKSGHRVLNFMKQISVVG